MMMQYIYYGALQKRRERILRLQAERRQRRRHQHPPRTQPIEAAPANPTTSRSDSILRPAAAAQNQQPSGGSNSHPMLRQPPNGKQESCHAAGHPAATPQQVGQQLPGSCAAAATRSRSELPSQLPGAAQAPMRPAAVLLSLGALAMVASVALLSTGGPGSTHAVAGTMGSRAMLASPQSLAAMQAAASGAGGGGQAASSALEGPTAAGGVQRPGGGGGGAPSARAASFGPRAAVFDAPDDWMKVAGTFLGWVSSVLYLSSRVSQVRGWCGTLPGVARLRAEVEAPRAGCLERPAPPACWCPPAHVACAVAPACPAPQILKNRSRQDTEGLAVAMFMVAVSANFCTGTGIILRTFSWQELQDQAPWIVGSLGTIMLDLTILAQSRRYAALHAAGGGGGGGGARSHARPQDDDGDGSDQPLLMV